MRIDCNVYIVESDLRRRDILWNIIDNLDLLYRGGQDVSFKMRTRTRRYPLRLVGLSVYSGVRILYYNAICSACNGLYYARLRRKHFGSVAKRRID